MTDVVIVSAVRTALGRLGGALKDVQPEELAQDRHRGRRGARRRRAGGRWTRSSSARPSRAPTPPTWRGWRRSRPASRSRCRPTRSCASAARACRRSTTPLQAIRAGEAEIVVAGGVESMSLAPYYLRGARFGFGSGNTVVVDSNTESQPRSQPYEVYGDLTMGLTAENLAEQYGITREEQDAFALQQPGARLRRHRGGPLRGRDRARCEVPARKGPATVFDTDEYPRRTSLEQLAALRAGLQGGRQRHRRQLVRPQRRRRLPRAHVGRRRPRRAASSRWRPSAAHAVAGVDPRYHGHRARPRPRARRSSGPA